MAEGWDSESVTGSKPASPWQMNGSYLSELYETSLTVCNEFIREFCRHVSILYGRALSERVENLSLDERNKRLAGVLLQLGYEELLSALDGMSLYRLMDVDFEGLLSCTPLDCCESISLCTESGGVDLSEIRVSVDYIYGELFGSDFQRLVTCLTRTGKELTEALRDVLTSKHGLYYEWRRVALRLEAEMAANYVPGPDIWNAVLTNTDNPNREVSN
jgi:hypothetical protein